MRALAIPFALLLTFGSSTALAADFNSSMTAYERQDYRAAFTGFEELAQNGDADAQYMLGRAYQQGHGVLQDFVQAHKWYNLAAAGGHRQAATARDDIAKRMTPSQVEDAQTQARQWSATPPPVVTAPITPPTPVILSPRETLAGIQRELNTLGYDAGPVDGLMGSRTRSAIRQYQSDQRIAVTGESSAQLLQRLQASTQAPPLLPADPVVTTPNDDWPWRKLILRETFQSTRNLSAWEVAAGQFTVDSGIGLRSVVEPEQAAARNTAPEDIPSAIIQAMLNEALGQGGSSAQAQFDHAEIFAPVAITNAFAIEMDINARQATGLLEFGPYQGSDRASGYRVLFTPNEERPFRLLRVTRSGSSIIETAENPIRLEYGRQYALRWTRDSAGEMALFLDGEELLRTTDRAFREDFSGFTLVNRGGDYGLRTIAIHGTAP